MAGETTVTMKRYQDWFRGAIRGKTRIALAWISVFLIGFLAREFPKWPGIAVCFAGASLRYWASGFLRKDSRPAVGGPYAWVRNPLYLGTFLMAVGASIAIERIGLTVFLALAFGILYHYIILDEETKLREIFGEPYLKYCQAVPRFFPWRGKASSEELQTINPDLSHHRFSHELANRNKAYEAYVSFIGVLVLLTLVAWLWSTGA
jgi:protein-S-isoprenylcysteine O-methyltransferase Ste14